MINLLLCGNNKFFDGALTQLISIKNRTNDTINCYIFTMDASRLNKEYICMTDEQIDFLNTVVKSKMLQLFFNYLKPIHYSIINAPC